MNRTENLLSQRAGDANDPGDIENAKQRGASMNGVLLEAFRHNSWATRQLLAFCRDLSEWS
jgi:hypothetical protein